MRLLGPYLMRFVAKKAAQRFENAFSQNPFGAPQSQSEGNNSHQKSSETLKSNGKVVGEYVDFEEVE